MKRPVVFTEKSIKLLEKEAARIAFLQEKIRKYKEELNKIHDANTWINYCSEDMWSGLSPQQSSHVCELAEKIRYCDEECQGRAVRKDAAYSLEDLFEDIEDWDEDDRF